MLIVILIVIRLSRAERTIMRTIDAVIEIIIVIIIIIIIMMTIITIITIWTRDWLGVYGKKDTFSWSLQALHGKQFKTAAGREKKIKNSGIYNTYHRQLSHEWADGTHWSLLWFVKLTKVMNNT